MRVLVSTSGTTQSTLQNQMLIRVDKRYCLLVHVSPVLSTPVHYCVPLFSRPGTPSSGDPDVSRTHSIHVQPCRSQIFWVTSVFGPGMRAIPDLPQSASLAAEGNSRIRSNTALSFRPSQEPQLEHRPKVFILSDAPGGTVTGPCLGDVFCVVFALSICVDGPKAVIKVLNVVKAFQALLQRLLLRSS